MELPAERTSTREGSGRDRTGTRWLLLIIGTVFLVSIGSPLLGLGVFHGADMVLDRSPWRTTPPQERVASNPIVGDTVSTFMPLHAEVRRRILDGDLPLWTPYPAGGLPLATVPDAGMFGPLNLPYVILPLWYAPGIAKLLELAVAAGFTFLFLRRIGLSRPAALTGGLIFAMSGFQVVWTNWPQSHVGALIPALFWAVERGLQLRSVRAALPVAVVLAAMVFEGFPSLAGYAVLAAGVYAVVRSAGERGLAPAVRVRTVLLLGGAVVLGLGLTTPQAFLLADRVGELDLGYRAQSPDSHLPPSTLATLALPDVFGSPVDDTYVGPSNYVEIQGFIGASSMVLVAAAAAWPGAPRLSRGVRPYLWASTIVVALLLYVGGPLLAGFQLTSLFELNFVGRLRSVLGFLLAVLAAIGLEASVERGSRRSGTARWRGPVVWGGATLLAAVGLWRAWIVAGWGAVPEIRWAIPVAAGLVAAGAVATSRLGRRSLAIWVIPVAFAVEALVFAVPFWPRIPREAFYPTTPAHVALLQRLGRDRMVGASGAFFPGTTTFYGIRSLTTNNTLPQLPEWEELVRAADPDAFDQSPVFPSLAPRPDVATSPVLDHLAVRYFTVPPNLPVFGSREAVSAGIGGELDLPAGGELDVPLPGRPIRAIILRLARSPNVPQGARVTARILDPTGVVKGEGFQLLTEAEPAGILQVPVTQPCGPEDCPPNFTVEVGLATNDGELALVSAGDGFPAISIVTDPADGLRLDLVANVVGYRRLDVLPRIRWAGTAVVEPDPEDRVRMLDGDEADPGTVVLSRDGPAGSGEPAELLVLEDAGDEIEVWVAAPGPGYVVVADPLQQGWVAEVDGEEAPLRSADHAGVAVLVPEGEHYVRLLYDPPGWSVGWLVAVVCLLVLVAGAVVARPRRAR